MGIITLSDDHGTYYTSDGNSSEPLTLSQMQVNARYLYDFMSSIGVSTNAICGMLGNFQVESTINPGRWQNDNVGSTSLGYGLAQWTPATKYLNYFEDYGFGEEYYGSGKIYEMKYQIGYLYGYELENHSEYFPTDNYPETYEEFLVSTKSPTYLAKAFLYNYERAGVEKVDLRVQYANYWYEFLTGSPPPIDPGDPDPPTPTPSSKKKKGYNFVLFNKRRRIYG
jgi:hypothetical protein